MIQEFNYIERIDGELELPGDKSISHRAVMFAAMAKGESIIHNLSNGDDVLSTQKCFRSLGAEIFHEKKYIKIIGKGFKGFKKPSKNLDAGNSGTTTRLISGILAGQDFESVIVGDSSLSRRPMKRIITPLTAMGGKLSATENFTLPLKIYPSPKLTPLHYELPIASAQVKSSVLLAGLHIDEPTIVIEKFPSRDHTERMLGLKSQKTENGIEITSSRSYYPEPKEYFVPSDISTAAFFIVLGLLMPDSCLRIKNVSLNPTRTGILDVLKNMGGNIETENEKEITGEPFGDILVRSSKLKNIPLPEEKIPNIIDEIPILAIAGIFAEGDFEIKNVSELRGKETDRIQAICYNLKKTGLEVEEFEDGFNILGNMNQNFSNFESFDDHRIAMAFGVLSLLLKQGGKVNNFRCVSVSNPDFLNQLNKIIR
jgi:3-phosphoshikimate 1-carboxyvinyltransferase